jgi:hypothetical protein
LTEPKRFGNISFMDTIRRDLMTRRDAALKAGDIALFQSLTVQIAALPLAGVPALTQKDIDRYVAGKKRRAS